MFFGSGPLNAEDDEETLVEGWRLDPQRVPHAFAHGALVFIHGMLKPQPSSLSDEVVLDSVPVWNMNEVLDASPTPPSLRLLACLPT